MLHVKNTAKKSSGSRRTKKNRLTILLYCAVFSKKRSRLIKNQEDSRLERH